MLSKACTWHISHSSVAHTIGSQCVCVRRSLKVRLVDFLRENYKETAEESQQRLHHLQGQAEMRRRYDLINELFDMWDNDKSGSLELDELQLVIRTWKDFSDEQALLHGKGISLLYKWTVPYIRSTSYACNCKLH